MGAGLAGIRIAVLGGDDRELVLIPELVSLGAHVTAYGFNPQQNLGAARLATDLQDALKNVQAVVMPMPGTDAHGVVRAVYSQEPVVLTEEALSLLPAGTPVIIGTARLFLKEWARKFGLNLIEIAEHDDVAILNSIPSAEGAILIAMQEMPITLHGSQAFVLGFGRLGATLARMLWGIGAHVTIVARKASAMARGFEQGYRSLDFARLSRVIDEADVIFNTVPAMVLNERLLTSLAPGTLVVDLAAQPGGTDFPVAERLGIKAILAPGLPGKVAPVTAGRILAQVVPELIVNAISYGG